ncbi:MAG TPA: LON peptidase substrate-binding domain-containing protein [Burkholderiales bacterium]|nr:LON peptidase substrate-binding domain-containing protein [Burkholderiales bacterium]
MSLSNVPIFPLNAVLFPGGLLPLRVFEARYMDMTRDCLKRDEPFGVCLIREGAEVGAPAVPEAIGCMAKILEWDMQQQGILNIKTRGGQRFRILERRVAAQGLTSANVELIPPEESTAVPEEFAACARLLEMVVADQGKPIFAEPHAYNDASWVGYRLAEILPVPLIAKQKLLELTDSLARLSILQRFLESRGLAEKPS